MSSAALPLLPCQGQHTCRGRAGMEAPGPGSCLIERSLGLVASPTHDAYRATASAPRDLGTVQPPALHLPHEHDKPVRAIRSEADSRLQRRQEGWEGGQGMELAPRGGGRGAGGLGTRDPLGARSSRATGT